MQLSIPLECYHVSASWPLFYWNFPALRVYLVTWQGLWSDRMVNLPGFSHTTHKVHGVSHLFVCFLGFYVPNGLFWAGWTTFYQEKLINWFEVWTMYQNVWSKASNWSRSWRWYVSLIISFGRFLSRSYIYCVTFVFLWHLDVIVGC